MVMEVGCLRGCEGRWGGGVDGDASGVCEGL